MPSSHDSCKCSSVMVRKSIFSLFTYSTSITKYGATVSRDCRRPGSLQKSGNDFDLFFVFLWVSAQLQMMSKQIILHNNIKTVSETVVSTFLVNLVRISPPFSHEGHRHVFYVMFQLPRSHYVKTRIADKHERNTNRQMHVTSAVCHYSPFMA